MKAQTVKHFARQVEHFRLAQEGTVRRHVKNKPATFIHMLLGSALAFASNLVSLLCHLGLQKLPVLDLRL